MNMKKTIAALAAGAVAVSAMATTVSALESKTLSYNLVRTVGKMADGKVTLKATFPNVKLVAGTNVQLQAKGMGWTDKVVISGQYIDTNKAINPITVTRDIWSEGYSYATETLLGGDNVITIPVKAVNDGTPALIGGVVTAGVEGTEGTAATATAVASAGNILNVNTTILEANKVAAGTYTLTYAAAVPAGIAAAAGWYSDNAFTTAVTDAATIAALDALKAADTTGATEFSVDGGTTTYYYSAGKEATPAVLAGFYDANGNAAAFYGVDATVITTPNAGDTITITYTAATEGTDAVEATDGIMANITITATFKAITDKDIETVNKKVQNGTYAIQINNNGEGWKLGDATTSAFSAPSKGCAPFRTGLTNNWNIVSYLETYALTGSDVDKPYKNATAVINDAIESYDNVTFTFNTATQRVKDADFVDDNGNISTIPVYTPNSWEGTDMYLAFGQHLYPTYYAPEGTEYAGYDWAGVNLFAGALIVNEGLTMSLADTEVFDWTQTAISFDWDAIMEGTVTDNGYATYVHSLKLATSATWYWDSMDLVLTVGEAGDVSADAGVEGDEETLDEEDAEEEEIEEPAEEPEEEPAEEPEEPAEEPAPAPEVSNPTTGNASVALAVIPVALAAAAVVAKKRG